MSVTELVAFQAGVAALVVVLGVAITLLVNWIERQR